MQCFLVKTNFRQLFPLNLLIPNLNYTREIELINKLFQIRLNNQHDISHDKIALDEDERMTVTDLRCRATAKKEFVNGNYY